MKPSLFLTAVLFAIISGTLSAQLKINQYGRIGMGIDPHPFYKLLIKGDLTLTTYPEIPPPLNRYTELRFKVGNGWPGTEIGTPTRRIAFWASEVGFNEIYAAQYYVISDTSLKANIAPVTNALETILQMNSYSYNMKYDSIVDEKRSFGFLAQEIQAILPDITDSAKGILLVDYQQMIPLVVEAVKEQQTIIDSLKTIIDSLINWQPALRIAEPEGYSQLNIDSLIHEIKEIKSQITTCCNQRSGDIDVNLHSHSVLFQNKPNPFSEQTVIGFDIREEFKSASIMVFDLQGILKKTIPITQKEQGQVSINGFELIAGMYLYSLIIDDKEIDTKRMILVR